jgi:hypothetical protein
VRRRNRHGVAFAGLTGSVRRNHRRHLLYDQPVQPAELRKSASRVVGMGHTRAMTLPTDRPALLVVDAANVVGSVPDGWWRDRAGAAQRLRDSLAGVAAHGLPGRLDSAPVEVVLVVEGAAKGVSGVDGVRVVSAQGSGDDAIVDVVRTEGTDRRVAVVTADRELRGRVTELGAEILGPRLVHPTTARHPT